jgi:hypothetical protein
MCHRGPVSSGCVARLVDSRLEPLERGPWVERVELVEICRIATRQDETAINVGAFPSFHFEAGSPEAHRDAVPLDLQFLRSMGIGLPDLRDELLVLDR